MNRRPEIMIVEDEKLAGRAIIDNLKKRGFSAVHFETGEEALVYFGENPVDIIVLDFKLPGIDGEEFYRNVLEKQPNIPVIFMTAYSSVEKAVRLLKMGAYSYLTKPVEMDELNHNIDKILEKIELTEENASLREKIRENISIENFIFNSEKMQEVISLTNRVADSGANVLLTGESGTGKEVIANLLHHGSKRKNNKFIKVNIAALPETLIEAELFGAVKGAYTGSVENRIGKFEEADGGSIFLDEIGDLSIDLQAKLLRTIQEKEITRLGSNKVTKTDVRLITATNKNLKKMITDGTFREDLYFRLNVINIDLPPLRGRREDIPGLIDLFIRKYSTRENKEIDSISSDALSALTKYDYKGNIRELENIIERGVVLARKEKLTLKDFPVYINSGDGSEFDISDLDSSLSLAEKLNIVEKKIIIKSLKKHNYNQTKTAEELKISESGLRYKLKSLKIEKN